MNLELLQQTLRERGIEAWLFYDFEHSDPIAYRVLGLSTEAISTRRWYYLVPSQGSPVKLVHRIESGQLDSLPGEKRVYAAWQEQRQCLQAMLEPFGSLAMQYSPGNQIPYISKVDAGTVEMIRSFGKKIVSSADLVQLFEARWTPEALESHLAAGRQIDSIISEAFVLMGTQVSTDGETSEAAVQDFILEKFKKTGLVTSDPPIVAVNGNSGNPHYAVSRERPSPIRAGDFVLLDVWAKQNKPGAVYYDVTWTGFIGDNPPEKIQQVFEIVRTARDRAVEMVQAAVREGRKLCGWEIDRVARDFIAQNGYGDCFLHRTGHSIGETVHGNGANIDDLETRDEREIIPLTAFSIEPGIYLPEFGVRSEVNVFVNEREARVTGAVQHEVVCIPSHPRVSGVKNAV